MSNLKREYLTSLNICTLCKKDLVSVSCQCGEIYCLECGLNQGAYDPKEDTFDYCNICQDHNDLPTPDYSILKAVKPYPEGWKTFFKDNSSELKKVQQNLSKTNSRVFPPQEEVFTAFHLTSPKDIKVVIVGQDPYHSEGQAHGLSFSVKKGGVPPSLKNIYKELEADGFIISNKKFGDLTKWAKQGVFLYNTALTVEEGKPMAHAKFWNTFSDQVIRYINYNCKNVVFILWGGEAQKLKKIIKSDKHCIIESCHPSPLSVARGFYGSRPFSKANNYLEDNGKKVIDWSL